MSLDVTIIHTKRCRLQSADASKPVAKRNTGLLVRNCCPTKSHDVPQSSDCWCYMQSCKHKQATSVSQRHRLTHIVSRPAQLCHILTWVTGSTGSPGHMVLGSLGHWVTKSDPVPSLRSMVKSLQGRGLKLQFDWNFNQHCVSYLSYGYNIW